MISLPLMNNLCKRWTLPTHIQKDCDLYFLRNLSDQEFVSCLKLSADGNDLLISEYGVNFTVLFQHGADKIYTRNGELAKRNEPNNTNYWCSFRSITFQWQGVACVKSYVLVQVDKGVKDFRDMKEVKTTRERPEGTPRGHLDKSNFLDLNPNTNPDYLKDFEKLQFMGDSTHKRKTYAGLTHKSRGMTFAEASQLKESEED